MGARGRLQVNAPCPSPGGEVNISCVAAAGLGRGGRLLPHRDLGRIAARADVNTLAPTLIGAGHLLFADRESGPPDAEAVRKVVITVIGGSL
jgi:hypothetical protein